MITWKRWLQEIYPPEKHLIFPKTYGSFERLVALLGYSKGVDVGTFDSVGLKTIKQLHEQIRNYDLCALLIPDDFPYADADKAGRFLLVRKSVKTLITAEGFELLETRRIYHKNGRETVHESKKDYSSSESRRVGELPVETAVRALKEEFELEVPADQFSAHNAADEIMPVRESRVYPGVLSQELIQRVYLSLPERPWSTGKIFVDDDTEIHTEWFPQGPGR